MRLEFTTKESSISHIKGCEHSISIEYLCSDICFRHTSNCGTQTLQHIVHALEKESRKLQMFIDDYEENRK
jgi:hypothetical protein